MLLSSEAMLVLDSLRRIEEMVGERRLRPGGRVAVSIPTPAKLGWRGECFDARKVAENSERRNSETPASLRLPSPQRAANLAAGMLPRSSCTAA